LLLESLAVCDLAKSPLMSGANFVMELSVHADHSLNWLSVDCVSVEGIL
jgi:hypothetical protein